MLTTSAPLRSSSATSGKYLRGHQGDSRGLGFGLGDGRGLGLTVRVRVRRWSGVRVRVRVRRWSRVRVRVTVRVRRWSRVRVRVTIRVRGRRWSSVRVRVRRWSRVRVTVRIRRWPGVRVRFQVRIRVSGKCLLNIRGIEAMAEGTCTCPVPNHPESPSAITPIHDSITTIVNNNAHLEGSDSRVSMKMPSRVILAWAWGTQRAHSS